MTARTSQLLADALRSAGFEELAVRAEADEFHDFLSPHELPEIMLAQILAGIIHGTKDQRERIAAINIRQRLIDGEFDADEKESEEWANSPDGQDAFRRLARGE